MDGLHRLLVPTIEHFFVFGQFIPLGMGQGAEQQKSCES